MLINRYMDKKLTIVITTYNRKDQLLGVMQSLENQGLYDYYNIIVSNNVSNYDVDKWFDDKLTPAFRKIVSVYNRPYNVGGDVNISFTFQLVKTQWMWLLSDDDITVPESIRTILEDIEERSETCWLKYSIEGEKYKKFEDREINNLIDLFNYFSLKPHHYGELNFQSNNVFNLELLKNYIGFAPLYASTCLSQLFPALFAIKTEGKPMLLRPKALIYHGTGEISYNLLYAYMNVGNVLYSKLNLNKDEIKAFKKLISRSYDNFHHLSALMKVDNRALRFQCFKKLLIENYYIFSFKGQAFALSFLFFHTFNITTEKIKKIAKMLSIRY